MTYSIVLPCFNEQGTIPSLVRAFSEVVKEDPKIEVIFVNNGSTDGTGKILHEQLAKIHRVRGLLKIVELKVNKGYGFGILQGLKVARGSLIGWTHADSQYDPSLVPLGFKALAKEINQNGPTLLKGRRIQRGPLDSLFTMGMSVLASAVLKKQLWDINAQPKMFHRQMLPLLRDAPHDFALDCYLLYIARINGINIIDMPVKYGRRLCDEAKGGDKLALKWRLSIRTTKYLFALKKSLKNKINNAKT